MLTICEKSGIAVFSETVMNFKSHSSNDGGRFDKIPAMLSLLLSETNGIEFGVCAYHRIS